MGQYSQTVNSVFAVDSSCEAPGDEELLQVKRLFFLSLLSFLSLFSINFFGKQLKRLPPRGASWTTTSLLLTKCLFIGSFCVPVSLHAPSSIHTLSDPTFISTSGVTLLEQCCILYSDTSCVICIAQYVSLQHNFIPNACPSRRGYLPLLWQQMLSQATVCLCS